MTRRWLRLLLLRLLRRCRLCLRGRRSWWWRCGGALSWETLTIRAVETWRSHASVDGHSRSTLYTRVRKSTEALRRSTGTTQRWRQTGTSEARRELSLRRISRGERLLLVVVRHSNCQWIERVLIWRRRLLAMSDGLRSSGRRGVVRHWSEIGSLGRGA